MPHEEREYESCCSCCCWKSPGSERSDTSLSQSCNAPSRQTNTTASPPQAYQAYHTLPSRRSLFFALPPFNLTLCQYSLSHTKLLTSPWPTERSSQSPSTTSSRLVSQHHAPDKQIKHPSLISHQGRQKRKNEQLAQDIFGKNRRQSAPAAGNTKKGPIGGSLASRVGVTKVFFADQNRSSRAARLTTSTAHSIDPSLE